MEALERIKEVINSGNTTKLDDWLELASSYKLSGSDNAEAIKNIEKFVTDNFSFETTAENAYVYFGSDGSVDMWQCVDIICKDTSQSSGYISSTQAGKLFNDVGFNEFLETILGEDNNLLKKVDGIKALYDGTDASGKVIIDAGNNETKEVQALNDFFSENYIKGIKSKNIKTIFSGDILARNNKGLNAFCRTELEQIFLNDNIENINGIEKSLIQKLKEAAPKGEEYDYVTNVLKASQISEIKNKIIIEKERKKDGTMTREEKMFFDEIEKKSKNNPIIKVEITAEEISDYLINKCTDSQKRVNADSLLYITSVLAGISCVKASMSDIRYSDAMERFEMPLLPVETEMGTFLVGDVINEYLANGKLSILNIFYSLYKNKQKDVVLPDIQKVVEKNSANMGKAKYRLWNDKHNPYAEKEKFSIIYDGVIKHIEPFNVDAKMMPAVFGFVLNEITGKVAGVFPENINCYEMVLETVIFNAHMAY